MGPVTSKSGRLKRFLAIAAFNRNTDVAGDIISSINYIRANLVDLGYATQLDETKCLKLKTSVM